MDRFLGKKLDGRYEIMEIIGVGGMANVYKAYDVIDDRIVAVKILRDEYLENEEFLRRFKNEGKAIAVLSHPNIVKIFDVSFSNKIQSIVMECIDGITLKEYIEQQGKLRWKEAVYFTVQILRALQHAHDKGIVHRDVKPHNIMLLSDGTIKITDFGIARFARSETRTLTDRAIGSVHYISPEQASGDTTDQRTDIYSVGVMLYEMLTGTLPFEADSPVSVALKQIQMEAPRPRQVNPAIPEGLEAITMHAMEKDVNKRYQSAAQMLRDIDEFKQNPSIQFEYKYLDDPKEINAMSKNTVQNSQNRSKTGTSGGKGQLKRKTSSKKRAPIIPVLAGVTLAFVIVSAAFIAWMFYLNNPFVTVQDISVPTLVGLKYDTVKNSEKYSNFEIQVEITDFNDEYGKGMIFEQFPKPGRTVKIDSIIKVKVSSGQQMVTLPDYAGQDAAQVFASLRERGLESDEKQMFSKDVPEGSVVKTSPEKGQDVPSATIVTVFVSMGPEDKWVEVPNLVGIGLEDAKTLLQNFKLKIGKIERKESEMPSGTIFEQTPAPTSQVEQGTVIDVLVSSGDEEFVRLSMQIPLPTDVKESVTLQVIANGVEVAKDVVIPSELKIWKPIIEGSGQQTVEILYNGEIYQQYMLDFDQRGHRLLLDNSENFGTTAIPPAVSSDIPPAVPPADE